MLDYVPLDKDLQEPTLKRKRAEYLDMVKHYFGTEKAVDQDKREMSTFEKTNMKQIKKDVDRTLPEISLFAHEILHNMLIRILFVFTIRHPASGYVQGINDLCAPFILVFLSEHIKEAENPDNIYEISERQIQSMEPELLSCVEADAYWCLTKVIDDI